MGVPILRIIVFWGLYKGSPIYGNYHLKDQGGRMKEWTTKWKFNVVFRVEGQGDLVSRFMAMTEIRISLQG